MKVAANDATSESVNEERKLHCRFHIPRLSESQNIVDFAKIYSKHSEEKIWENLPQLSKELMAITAEYKKKSTRTQNDVTVCHDEVESFISCSENAFDQNAVNDISLSTKKGMTLLSDLPTAKGKPMRRFTSLLNSPFDDVIRRAEQEELRRRSLQSLAADDSESIRDNAMYEKVEQIPWEHMIVWKEKPTSDLEDTTHCVEEQDDEQEVSNESDHMATKSMTKVENRLLGEKAVKLKKKEDSLLIYVPDSSDIVRDFDMTKPRHYRWEFEGAHSTARSDPVLPNTCSGGPTPSESVSTEVEASTRAIASLPCPLNKELENGSWLDAIGWNCTQEMPDTKLVLDDNDTNIILSLPETEDIRPTLRIPERKLGAAEQRLEQLDKQRREKKQRIDEVMGNLEFGEETAEGRLGTDGTGKKSKETRIIKNIGHVHHSLPAIKLTMTKPELPKSKLREFHRPRGKFKINERLLFARAPKVAIPQKIEKNVMVVTQIKKSSDLNPTAGGKLIMVEYTEQNPPILSNLGMASRVLHYWRPPEDDDDHVLGKKKTKKAKPKPPEMPMGQVISLGDHDESPFVGDIPPGRVVTSLNSKLYKIPIFRHKAVIPFATNAADREAGSHVLFLLCRSISKHKKGSSSIDSSSAGMGAKSTIYIMELPELYVAGQIEPQLEVPAPNSRSANDFIRPYMSFHILRLFKKASDGERLKIEDVARAFPNQSGTAIRKRMKEVATFERGGNDSGWWKKKAANQLTSEEEIRSSIPPENVCLYESMMAGHRRLSDIGLTKLFSPSGVNSAINLMLKRLELRRQALTTKFIDSLILDRASAREKAQKELWKSDPMIRKLEKDIQIARYINEQLQITPWNLTNNYVECHLQGKGSGMLQLGGIGDPTGRGEGFSFVRVPQSRAKKKDGEDGNDAGGAAPNADSAAVQKAVAAVTGTTADLRKLKMKEAGDVLRNLGLAEADIKKLRRWDRIHMVRELSSRATAHGVAGTLSKFARGARKSLSAQQQEYRKKCDVIYERQMDVLSSSRVTFSSDEEEGDDLDLSDFDDFEKEVEAGILGGGDAEKMVRRGPEKLFLKGGGGLNRTREALAEREDIVQLRRLMEEMKEDGATSAATVDVQRLDADINSLRNESRVNETREEGTSAPQKAVVTGMRAESMISSALVTPTDYLSRSSSPQHANNDIESKKPTLCTGGRIPGRQVLKRITRVVEEDGTERTRIEFIIDEKQIARFKALQQRKERLQNVEERNQLRKRKRMLALEGDPINQNLLNKAKKRKQLQEELKQLQKTEEENKGYQELLQKQGEEEALSQLANSAAQLKGVIRCTQCGQHE
ncbi:hypothetical protein ABG067_000636 [Albugo candida]